MNIVICGAGDIGSHAAEMLASADHRITVIDQVASHLTAIEDAMDVRTLLGNCAVADVLKRADVGDADLVLAATDKDEVNLLTASIAKGMGAKKCIARVHHSAFFERPAFDYQRHFDIDRLICPEYATALAIARKLRNPGAVAIENFARGRIEMQEFVASKSGSAVGKRLTDAKMPAGSRLVMVSRQKQAIVPKAESVVVPGDSVILVANFGAFADARKLFQADKQPRKSIVLMGGPPIAVWLARSLRDRNFSIRLFEKDRRRAEALAEKLDWVTVIQDDPTDRTVFNEERLAQADVFVCLLDSDEENIVAGVFAKTRGVAQVVTVVQKAKYLDLVYDIGIDQLFSPRQVAAEEVDGFLDKGPIRHLSSLAEGDVDVFRIRVGEKSPVVDKPLHEIKLAPDWVIAAIQRDREAFVPKADDVISAHDVILAVGKCGKEKALRKLFALK